MPSQKNPLAYTGRVLGSTAKAGDLQLDSTDFSVDAFGKVSLLTTSIKYTETTLTSAQVKALAATQIELVAAPGAGKQIEFISAMLKLDYGGTNAFTETADNLAIKYTDDSGAAVSETIETTGFIDQTADTIIYAQPAASAAIAATGVENQALVLDNTGDGEIAGNAGADNTLVVGVAYRVHSL